METSQPNRGEEDFIDMVVGPCSNLSSSVKSREFEFQMCTNSLDKEEVTPSPADELFYKGKLLPLHLPPRLQMVQKLLHNSISPTFEEEKECGSPIVSTTTSCTAPPTSSSSPLESCSISPTDSCRVSCELSPDEYFLQWSTGATALNGGVCDADAHLSKKPWSKKIKLIKQSAISQKLKSSREYMKSLFTRPACTVEASCAKSAGAGGDEAWNVSKAREYVNKYIKLVKKNPYGQMENEGNQVSYNTVENNVLDSEMDDHISFTCHRLSFSKAIKRHSTSSKHSLSTRTTSTSSNCSCSSSSFSLISTNGFYEINLLKKGVSANLEVENSIEGAIAHCKMSQQKQKHDFSVKKTTPQSEVET